MALIQSICVHGVTSIKIDPRKEHMTGSDSYVTRTITICAGNQKIELTCFSENGSLDDDNELMRFIV